MNSDLKSAGRAANSVSRAVQRNLRGFAGLLAAVAAAAGVSGSDRAFADNDEQRQPDAAASLTISSRPE